MLQMNAEYPPMTFWGTFTFCQLKFEAKQTQAGKKDM